MWKKHKDLTSTSDFSLNMSHGLGKNYSWQPISKLHSFGHTVARTQSLHLGHYQCHSFLIDGVLMWRFKTSRESPGSFNIAIQLRSIYRMQNREFSIWRELGLHTLDLHYKM
jgi:hypothetical protein